jgi:hypothetical protein
MRWYVFFPNNSPTPESPSIHGPKLEMRRHGLVALFVEAFPICGPIACFGVNLVAYLMWNREIPEFGAVLGAPTLSVLALTPFICGLGWFALGRPAVGLAIVLLRILTIIVGVHALLAVDGDGCSTCCARASCAELYAAAAAFIGLPIGSSVALAWLEVFPRHPAAAGRS